TLTTPTAISTTPFTPIPTLFTATASPEIYTLSLHDALPICLRRPQRPAASAPRGASGRGTGLCLRAGWPAVGHGEPGHDGAGAADRKSTRLNSSHVASSYAVFCLKKKK